jgi:hypothetical protein
MPKTGGTGSLTLFNVQGDVEKEIRVLSTERMLQKLGLSKPEKKTVQSFDVPLVPVQEDFFLFPFRQLSATTVGGGSYKATDFSRDGVLKRSTSKLNGKPAYLNHNQSVGQEVGVIGECEYVASYKHNGIVIPAGVEGPFMIDSKLNPDLVRKMSSPISPIQCCSVSVIFEWEASHEFEREGDFYWHLGEIIDDEMVRRVAVDIVDYAESSLVWLGADPYARMLDDKGKVVSIDRSAAFTKNKFSDEPDNRKYESSARYFVFDCLDQEKFLHLSTSSEKFSKNPKPEKEIPMKEEVIIFFAAMFGTTPEKLKSGEFTKADAEKFTVKPTAEFAKMKSEDDFKKVSDELTLLKTEKANLETEKNNLTTEKANLATEKAKLEPLSKVGSSVLANAKAEAKRLYGIFSKGKEDAAIVAELENEADLDKLDSKIKMFGGHSVTEYGATCSECGSTKVNFRQSKQEGNPPPQERDFSLEEAAIN